LLISFETALEFPPCVDLSRRLMSAEGKREGVREQRAEGQAAKEGERGEEIKAMCTSWIN